MALKRLLLGICVLSVGLATVSYAQLETTTANQDGIFIMDAIGRAFSAPLDSNNIGPILFKELEATSQQFNFVIPIVQDVELVGDPNGEPRGAYVLDIYGGQFALNVSKYVTSPDSPRLPEPRPDGIGKYAPEKKFSIPPYWGFDVARDLAVAPDWRDVTFGFRGYYILDGDGVVHSVGDTNLPKYVYYAANSTDIASATYQYTLYPETLDVSGSTITANQLLTQGPITYPVNKPYASNMVDSVTPIFTYFGFGSDVARDLEVSVEYTTLTMPSQTNPGAIENRTIAMTNGYYILDKLGAVHSNRLPLDFDVDNDGAINYEKDVLGADGTQNPLFGEPINNAVLAVPWLADKANLPYFGGDFAVDFKITPSGKGFYLLDSYGKVHAVGDARTTLFPPKEVNGQLVAADQDTPYFGFPVARSLAIVPSKANPSLGLKENQVAVGYLVLDAFGTVHKAGSGDTYQVSEKGDGGNHVSMFSLIFKSLSTTPLWLTQQSPIKEFVVGSDAIPRSAAPNFRDVTIQYYNIATSAQAVSGPK